MTLRTMKVFDCMPWPPLELNGHEDGPNLVVGYLSGEYGSNGSFQEWTLSKLKRDLGHYSILSDAQSRDDAISCEYIIENLKKDDPELTDDEPFLITMAW